MSTSSQDFLMNAIKMLKNAEDEFNLGNFSSQLSYLYSAKQDIDNAIWKAEHEKLLKEQMK
jgi:hypothetical protein